MTLRAPAFHDLSTLLGEEILLVLIEAAGGTRIKVPKKARESSSLAGTIGLTALEMMVNAYGGAYVYIPIAKRFRVKALRKLGHSHSQIAVRLCISTEAVRRHLLNDKRKSAYGAAQKLAADAGGLKKRRKLP